MVSSALLSTDNVYLGRQPILDRSQSLYAFELLFRTGAENKAHVICDIAATSAVIVHTLSEFGIDVVLGRYTGFINCDASFLQSDAIELLPPEKIVLEILEKTIADEMILKRCIELKQYGFRLALDDFQGITSQNQAFLDLMDIIKVDVLGLTRQELRNIVDQLSGRNIVLLAEKVETKDEFNFCLELGFDLYQGYFFSKAEKISGKRFTAGQQTVVQLLGMVQSDSDVNSVVEAFKQSPTLSIGLLRLTNSASIGLRHVVTSIRSAVVLLGHKQLQRWLLLLLMAQGGTRKGLQTALIHQAAGRAKFMELMAMSQREWEPYAESAFITGIVSVMDALLGMETQVLVESLGLDVKVYDALTNRKGILGELLNLVEAMELDDMSKVTKFVDTESKGNYESLIQAQGQMIAWVNQIIDTGI